MTTQTFTIHNPSSNTLKIKVTGGPSPVYVLPGMWNDVTISTGQTYSVQLVAVDVVPQGGGPGNPRPPV